LGTASGGRSCGSFLGPNVNLPRERYGPAVGGRRDSVVARPIPQTQPPAESASAALHHFDLFAGVAGRSCGPLSLTTSLLFALLDLVTGLPQIFRPFKREPGQRGELGIYL
jgi:hypothetical protein